MESLSFNDNKLIQELSVNFQTGSNRQSIPIIKTKYLLYLFHNWVEDKCLLPHKKTNKTIYERVVSKACQLYKREKSFNDVVVVVGIQSTTGCGCYWEEF